MTFTKSNNPALIGVMVVILVGALYFVFLSLRTVVASASTKPADAATDSGAAPADDQPSAVISDDAISHPARTARLRDPFYHPVQATLDERATHAVPASNGNGSMSMDNVQSTAPWTPRLPNLAVQPIEIPSNAVPKPAPMAATDAVATADETATWRVTAIFGGGVKSASIEGVGVHPIVVTAGNTLQGYTVAAVSDRDVVLDKNGSLTTISLANDNAPPNTQGTKNAAVDDPSPAEETSHAPRPPSN